MKLSYISLSLAAGSALVQAATICILQKRKLRSSFPLFFAYSIFGVVAAVVGVADYLYSCSGPYWYLYFALNALFIALEFGIMYEVIVSVLKPYSALIDLGTLLFRWAALFLLSAAALTAVATSGAESGRLVAAVTVTERSMRLMQCGLLMLFFLFEKRLGLSWRNPPISLGLGLGASAAFGLIVAYLRHTSTWGFIGILDNASYFAIVTFWACCFMLAETQRKSVLDSPSRLIFQRWNEALLASPFVGGNQAFAASESFLPSVERTVERVMSRKMSD